jgi:hypothetical protein
MEVVAAVIPWAAWLLSSLAVAPMAAAEDILAAVVERIPLPEN